MADLHDLFQRALDLPTEQRDAFVDDACGDDRALRDEVKGLLAALDDAEGFLDAAGEPIAERPGDRIGRYRLLERIGEGGFGVVWMAEQLEPVRRQVAVKILKPGMDSRRVIARFEAERQALALMDHPNIARVLDGGTTSQGRPFFVMELVRGLPLVEFCDAARLPLEERLGVFVQVCRAVEHAHQKGIVHRDLKPSNLLVTTVDGRPMPKVIDFGVAKAILSDELTQLTMLTGFRQVLGTPEYMAPEQTGLSSVDIDTRADVYALGVVLYELLTGAKPFSIRESGQAGYLDFLQQVRDCLPPKPSTRVGMFGAELFGVARDRRVAPGRLGRLLRGDLDWIVCRALEKDRDRRYPTASSLGNDVERFLDGRPVDAGPPSRRYRIGRFVRRHRIGLTVAAGVFITLLGAVVATGLALQRALVAEAESRQDARRARAAIDALQDVLVAANPHSELGPDRTLREILDARGEELVERVSAEPVVEAKVRQILGASYRTMGLLDAAAPHLQRALELAHAKQPSDPQEVSDALWQWSWLLHDRRDYAGAESSMRESLALAERIDPVDPVAVAQRQYALADLLRHSGRLDEADELAAAAVESFERSDRARLEMALALNVRGMVAMDRRQAEIAEPLFRQALERCQDLEGPHGPTTASCLVNLGTALLMGGRAEDAAPVFEAAVEAKRAVVGEDNPALFPPLEGLAIARLRSGRAAAAEPVVRQMLAILERAGDRSSPRYERTLRSLADALEQTGRWGEAEEPYGVLVELQRGREAPSLALASSLANRGRALLLGDRAEEAVPLLREALQIRAALAPDDWLRWNAASLLGAALDAIGDPDAERHLREGYENMRPPAGWQKRRIEALDRWIAFHERRAGAATDGASAAVLAELQRERERVVDSQVAAGGEEQGR
ncbi:MAG: serine/threonine protein kinase [Planctomycetes bacterium]|nr:serine/threonine protein kinase [Planctomycetota bacterium]